MIKLYRKRGCAYCDEVQERLEEMVVAHQVLDAPDDDSEAPIIDESGRTFRGRDEIEPYLRALSRELTQSRSISGDACYLDPDDPSRCL